MAITKILDDTRTITALQMDGRSITREIGGKILAYEEPGDMGHVTWFAVWTKRGDDNPDMRVNGKHVHIVEYED